MLSKKRFVHLALLIVILLSAVSLSACSKNEAPVEASGARAAAASELPGHANHLMASTDDMPDEIKNAPVRVKSAYSFAVGSPQILKKLPCYCGCGGMGHNSLYACYVSSVESNGKINFDNHALGCTICVDIAQDGMRMVNEGKTVAEVRAYVDQTYAQYGTTNMP
jgi:hypothetical protein